LAGDVAAVPVAGGTAGVWALALVAKTPQARPAHKHSKRHPPRGKTLAAHKLREKTADGCMLNGLSKLQKSQNPQKGVLAPNILRFF